MTRFLMIPELRQGERWKFVCVLNHPMFKHSPLLQWSGPGGKVLVINRQLFYAMMTNRLEK